MVRLLWSRRSGEPASRPEPDAPAPLARRAAPAHLRLTVLVANRPTGAALPGARLAVRPLEPLRDWPEGREARAVARADGTAALLLPRGRYAVRIEHERLRKCITLTLERDGRATIWLDAPTVRAHLVVDARRADGSPLARAPVEVRAARADALLALPLTDEAGAASLWLAPGDYDLRVGAVLRRVRLRADGVVRLDELPLLPAPAPETPLVRRAREGAADLHRLPRPSMDHWN